MAEKAPEQPNQPASAIVPAPSLPGTLPLFQDLAAGPVAESWFRTGDALLVRNVSVPTLTPILPGPGKATGAAVIVAPGGGFLKLAMDAEGLQVARALADRGISAFVLKYRLIGTPADEREFESFSKARAARNRAIFQAGNSLPVPETGALQDALAALRLVRSKAAHWGVNPARIGMMGFSSGAQLALNMALTAPPADRPAFVAAIYPSMGEVAVPPGTPPLFAAIAMDDALFQPHVFALVESWRKANSPVELHAYERGGHSFGLGRPGTTTTLMLDQFQAWVQAPGPIAAQ